MFNPFRKTNRAKLEVRSAVRNLVIQSVVFFAITSAHAEIITFTDGGVFDGDVVGGTAALILDGEPVTLTTNALGGGATAINTNANTFGLEGGGSNAEFNNGESWGFSLSEGVVFEGIEFGEFTNAELFRLSATDWIGLTLGTTPIANVTYISGTGTFEFAAGFSSDDFDMSTANLGAELSVNAGSSITLAYAGSGTGATNEAIMENMTMSPASTAAVPEPASAALLTLVTVAAFHRRRTRKKSRKNAAE